MSQDQKQQLKKTMNVFQGIMYVIGLVIGSGVFLKPAVVLRNTGSTGAALLMWVFGGVITIAAALTVAELAAYIPKIGGLYTYLVELYGEAIGFLFGWVSALVNAPGTCGAVAIACATFATFFLPMTATQQKIFAISLVIILVIAQIISTKYGVWLQTAATIGKLLPIGAIIVFGLISGSAHDINFATIGNVKSAGTGVALLGVLWAYDGWVTTCTLAADMKEPEKNIPKAVVIGILTVMGVYVAFNAAIFNVLPGAVAANSQKIGVDVCTKLFGSAGAAFITAGMMISVFGTLNGMLTCGARYTLAMGERGHLPAANVLGTLHPKLGTPINALIFQAVVSIVYILTGTFNSITDLIVFVLWIFFNLGIGGVFILRKRVTRNPKLYHVPLFPILPIVGFGGGCYLLFATFKDSPSSALLGLAITLVGLPVYFYCKHKAIKEEPVDKNMN
ncbi:APC family permease [Clostridium aciditolerans]|uniref:Amino acid permease n=1 Tax=Clostridium aciditolerans TaxID=339861 RepID=A0A934HTD3_9CLOT|nr:amino acid permease [Clostridium aciditolerans]MBI6871089.1 amino acid permease [Clostridium aciditolerans]